MPYVLIASDGTKVTLTRKEMELSDLLKDTIMDDEENENEHPVPLGMLSGWQLEKFAAFARHHANNPMDKIKRPVTSANLGLFVSDPWDVQFIDLPYDDMINVRECGRHLLCFPMLKLSLAKAASCVTGKSRQEIRAWAGETKELTDEEFAEIRKLHDWVNYHVWVPDEDEGPAGPAPAVPAVAAAEGEAQEA